MSNQKQMIAEVIGGILSSANAEGAEAYSRISETPALKNVREAIQKGNPKEFDLFFQYPIRLMTAAMLSKENVCGDAAFLFSQYGFVEDNFKNLIKKYEGMACCADKSRTIIRRLLRFFMIGERIEFDYTGEYTYHLPETIFTTHEEIVDFFKGLQRLYYGRPDQYLVALAKMVKRVNEEKDEAAA